MRQNISRHKFSVTETKQGKSRRERRRRRQIRGDKGAGKETKMQSTFVRINVPTDKQALMIDPSNVNRKFNFASYDVLSPSLVAPSILTVSHLPLWANKR